MPQTMVINAFGEAIWRRASLPEPLVTKRAAEGCSSSPPQSRPAAATKHEEEAADGKAATIHQRYYPEGGWGWIVLVCASLVHLLTTGLHAAFGLLLLDILRVFGVAAVVNAVCVGSISTCVSIFLSPVVVAVCRRKSTRLLATLGGLVTALGCLFTSFASQFHQLFVSYGIFVGCGVSLTRETASIMVGTYFKKKRELVEIFVVSGTGVGIAVMPIVLAESIRSLGWRLGFQLMAGLVFATFFLAVFYRSASVYHPQRRAILHLKSMQKRSRLKDKNAVVEKPPFFDFAVLKSRTVQILVCGTGIAAFGINAPLVLLTYQGHKEGLDTKSLFVLQVFLGVASVVGTGAFGFVVVKNSVQCMIARQYLCQAASFMIGASLLALTALDEFHGYLLFVWVYGLFYGGYHYSLKMFTFEKVRARNFARAWGYVQWSQAIPNAIGIPLTSYLNEQFGGKTGFFVCSAFAFLGTITLFLIDVHKKSVKRRKTSVANDSRRFSDACQANPSRRSSTQDSTVAARANPHLSRLQQRSFTFSNYSDLRKQELTCISEEVFMENFLEDLMDITSCNKEEKYLMLSEYENNLQNTHEALERERRYRNALRKASVISAPKLEQCPNCLRIVDEGQQLPAEPPPVKTAVSVRQNRQKQQAKRANELTTTL